MNIADISPSQLNIESVDIDNISTKLDQLKKDQENLTVTVEQSKDFDAYQQNQPHQVNKPSWDGELKMVTRGDEPQVLDKYRCGR
ncbi:MAG: hypothetical protein P9X24_09210 [Candidatus Hatepunaea meridiana]|nr:hypothetical protein [Candidatus Hatepunaea meridiana]